jgi:hypothetical protein
MEGEPILKKTLVTVGVMVGAWVAFVGTVSLIAVLVTSHAVGAAPEAGGDRSSAPVAPRRTSPDGPHIAPQNVTPKSPPTPRPHDTI